MQVTAKRSGHRAVKFSALFASAALSIGLATVASSASSSAQPAKLAAAPRASTRGPNGSSPASKLKQIEAAAQAESKATFKLTYTSSGSGSSSSAVTLEQKPPQQLFKSGTGEVLFDGKRTYYCSSSGRSTTCLIYGSEGQSPLAGMMGIYSASTYVTIMQGWETIISARIAGFHISFTGARFAGQASECVTWSYQGSSAEYCVTDGGVLAYVGGKGSGSNSSFKLTSYSSRVSSSDFRIPRGAKITKLP